MSAGTLGWFLVASLAQAQPKVVDGKCEWGRKPDKTLVHTVESTYDRRVSLAEALDGAELKVRNKIMKERGAGRTEADLDVIRRNIHIRHVHDATARVICVEGLLDQGVWDDPSGEGNYQRKLDELAAQVSSLLPPKAQVYVEDPFLLGSGCRAGPWALPLKVELKKRLVSRDHVVLDQRGTGRSIVLLKLSGGIGGRPLQVEARVRETGQSEGRVAGSIEVGIHWVGLRNTERLACYTDPAKGIPERNRAGAGGLEVYLEIEDAPGGQLCEGQAYEIGVRVNEPAKVQLFSLDSRGRAVLIWPVMKADRSTPGGVVQDRMSIQNDFVSFVLDDEDLEHLVAVAVPVGSGFRKTDGLTRMCAIDGFSTRLFPYEAVDLRDLFIQRSGTGSCPSGQGLSLEEVKIYQAEWQKLMSCRLAD